VEEEQDVRPLRPAVVPWCLTQPCTHAAMSPVRQTRCSSILAVLVSVRQRLVLGPPLPLPLALLRLLRAIAFRWCPRLLPRKTTGLPLRRHQAALAEAEAEEEDEDANRAQAGASAAEVAEADEPPARDERRHRHERRCAFARRFKKKSLNLSEFFRF
jgi:hypothetical protein